MATPIIMLLLLTSPYLIIRALSSVTHKDYDSRGAASVGMGLLFVFTGVGHFIQTEPMTQMMPEWIPGRTLLVYGSGIVEFAIAAGFFSLRFRRIAGWIAAVLLLLFFPINVYAAMNYVPVGGHAWGPVYLFIRGPLQAFLLFWVYWFVIRGPASNQSADASN